MVSKSVTWHKQKCLGWCPLLVPLILLVPLVPYVHHLWEEQRSNLSAPTAEYFKIAATSGLRLKDFPWTDYLIALVMFIDR